MALHHRHHPVAFQPSASLLRLSAWQRLGLCGGLVAVLWTAVWWVIS